MYGPGSSTVAAYRIERAADLGDDATIFSQFVLGDHQNLNTQQLSTGEFYDAARSALDNGVHPGIWLRHSYGIASQPIVYLAEQYLP